MKIVILGYSGAGKSNLANSLGEITNLSVTYLDCIQFVENWKTRDTNEAIEMVKEVLGKQSWIIEGNYSQFLFDQRMNDADYILFLNYPRFICLARVFKRYIENKGKTRESIADGCIEKIDFEFLWWVLVLQRQKKYRYKMFDITKNKYSGKFYEFKSDIEVNQFIKETFIQ